MQGYMRIGQVVAQIGRVAEYPDGIAPEKCICQTMSNSDDMPGKNPVFLKMTGRKLLFRFLPVRGRSFGKERSIILCIEIMPGGFIFQDIPAFVCVDGMGSDIIQVSLVEDDHGRRKGKYGCPRSEEHPSELQSLMRNSY